MRPQHLAGAPTLGSHGAPAVPAPAAAPGTLELPAAATAVPRPNASCPNARDQLAPAQPGASPAVPTAAVPERATTAATATAAEPSTRRSPSTGAVPERAATAGTATAAEPSLRRSRSIGVRQSLFPARRSRPRTPMNDDDLFACIVPRASFGFSVRGAPQGGRHRFENGFSRWPVTSKLRSPGRSKLLRRARRPPVQRDHDASEEAGNNPRIRARAREDPISAVHQFLSRTESLNLSLGKVYIV